MKKQVINIVISILFSITLILTIISLTLLNKNFIMRVLVSKDYVHKITENINEDLKDLDADYVVLESDVEDYLKSYVKSRYKYEKKIIKMLLVI